METKQYNIYDIAKELELSPSTVSKALNNNDKISQKTKERVKAFIKEKGFTPNIVASSLKNKVSLSIGVAYPKTTKNVMTHYFFSHVIETFREYVEKKGYEFSYVSDRLGKYEVTFAEYVRQRNLDGVLILGATKNDQDMLDILKTGCKVVSLDYISDEVPFVQTNDIMGAQQIVSYIKTNKMKKVVYISAPFNLGEFQKRTSIFQGELAKSNIALSNIVEIEGTEFKDGFNGACKFLADCQEVPDVVVVSNDEIAFGVIRGIEKMGYKVPEDISVIGFDDMFFSQYFTPALTTVHQHCDEIGYLAGKTLINMLRNKEYKMENYVDCQLLVRDSSK